MGMKWVYARFMRKLLFALGDTVKRKIMSCILIMLYDMLLLLATGPVGVYRLGFPPGKVAFTY